MMPQRPTKRLKTRHNSCSPVSTEGQAWRYFLSESMGQHQPPSNPHFPFALNAASLAQTQGNHFSTICDACVPWKSLVLQCHHGLTLATLQASLLGQSSAVRDCRGHDQHHNTACKTMQSLHYHDGSSAESPIANRAVSRQPPAPQDWTSVSSVIYRLYVLEDRPLHFVKEQLEKEYGFKASERMFKDRLKKWGFSKNLTRDEWVYLAVLNKKRKSLGKRSTHFYVGGRRKTVRDLQKYSRSQRMTEDELAGSASSNIVLPDHLRAITPTPEEDGGALNDSPSDHSSKDTPSPHQRRVGNSHEKDHTFDSRNHSNPQTPSIETSKLPQEDLLFAPLGPADPLVPTDPHSFHNPLSPKSSGKATMTIRSSGTVRKASVSDSTTYGLCADMEPLPTDDADHFTNLDAQIARSWTSESDSAPSSCDNVSRELELISHQITNPSPIRSRNGEDDIKSWMVLDFSTTGNDPNNFGCSCSECHQPIASHFVSIHGTVPQEPSRRILNDTEDDTLDLPTTTKSDGAWRWIALCFLSCLNLTKGNHLLVENSLADASHEFERLLNEEDPLLLTAAGLTITILHMHDQASIATKIMLSAKSATDRLRAHSDPIRVTIDYLTASADTSQPSLKDRGITSDSLRTVYNELNMDPLKGSLHPYTIAAHYNYSWLLRNEGRFEEAETNLREVYRRSCSLFTKNHMQSIMAMATMAGAQYGQGKVAEAIHSYKQVIEDCKPTLGQRHPYRLEGKRRLAHMYGELGQKEMMVDLYWDVLAGRVQMLGRGHSYTLGQKKDYEDLMMELGRWDSGAQKEVEALFEAKQKAEEEAMRRKRSNSNSSHGSECLAF